MHLSTNHRPPLRAILFMLLAGGLTIPPGLAQPSRTAYDPLAVDENPAPQTLDLDVRDEARQRTIPIRVYLPAEPKPAPVVLFSHGLGGSRTGCAYLGQQWARRGYLAVFLQHPGSDTAVWASVPRDQRRDAMNKAANGRNFMLRVKDVPAVLDQLTAWNRGEHPLAGRMDLERIGMSGHSFGAVTTQAVAGQRYQGQALFTDPRIKAALILSPSAPANGKADAAFGKVAIPWLLMTGTRDVSVIGRATLESRLSVFPALPPGKKYELVLHDGQHSAFTQRPLPGDAPRNPNHHRAIRAISTAFWDAYLRDEPAARAWLDGPGPRNVLQQDDRWQKK